MKDVLERLNFSYDFLKRKITLEDKVSALLFANNLSPPDDESPYSGLYLSRTEFTGLRVQKSHFDASLFILYIYTTFEVFIDSIIEEYIKTIQSNAPNIDHVPDDILKNHTSLSIELLRSLEFYPHLVISEEEVLRNALAVSTRSDTFHLNSQAFVLHRSNYRTGVIRTQFEKIGIKILDRVQHVKQFKEFNLRNGILYNPNRIDFLEQLVEDRNNIVHGWRLNITPQSSEILATIDKFTALSSAIYDVLESDVVDFLIDSKDFRAVCDYVSHTYYGGTVLRVMLYSTIRLSIGDEFLYIKLNEQKQVVSFKRVVVINVSRHYTDLSTICMACNIEIGVKINTSVEKGGRLYRCRDRLEDLLDWRE